MYDEAAINSHVKCVSKSTIGTRRSVIFVSNNLDFFIPRISSASFWKLSDQRVFSRSLFILLPICPFRTLVSSSILSTYPVYLVVGVSQYFQCFTSAVQSYTSLKNFVSKTPSIFPAFPVKGLTFTPICNRGLIRIFYMVILVVLWANSDFIPLCSARRTLFLLIILEKR